MKHVNESVFIVLSYKRKLLLCRKEDYSTLVNKNAWSFIGKSISKSEQSEQAIVKEVQAELNITLSSMVLIASQGEYEEKITFYQAELTDKNVNEIHRNEGQEIQFFTLKEIEKLVLAPLIQDFLLNHKNNLDNYLSTP